MGRTTRRVFLKRTAGLLVLLGLGGVGRHVFRRRVELPAGLHYLDEREAETLLHLSGVMLPPEEGFPSLEDVQLLRRLDQKIGHLSRAERRDLKSLLYAFESFAVVMGPAAGAFSSLSEVERHRYVKGWMNSGLKVKRVGFSALKQLVFYTYYTHPQSWPALEYAGPWVGPKGLGGAP